MSLSFRAKRLSKTFCLGYVLSMDSAELPFVLSLYARIAPGELFRLLQRGTGRCTHDGIYTPRVVIWMMMLQRLDRRGTLASAVEQLALGRFDCVLSRCKRVQQGRIAVSTGGYCQARQNLPKMLLERSVEEIIQRLRNHLHEQLGVSTQPVYVLDGSTLQLDSSAELKQAYPPARSARRPSHWPRVLMVVLHDVDTGLAEHPCWGPVHGPEAVSEQALAARVLDPVPPGAVIIGDRNFGVFSVAHAASQRGQKVVIRLTQARAKRLGGAALDQPGAYAVEWAPSALEQRKHGKLPTDVIRGRLIVWRVGRGKSQQWLYLFTTWSVAPEEIVAAYGKRWHIETDLRSLKQTVRLNRISGQTVGTLEKELLAAVLAYNLVRAILCLAARRAGLHVRQLSFTYAYNIVQDGIMSVLAAAPLEEQAERMDRLIGLVARCKLPNRTKRRSFPRAVWRRGCAFPTRREKTK
jgi:hypothetical protein